MEPIHTGYTFWLPWAGWILPNAGMPLERSRRLLIEGYALERVAEEEGHTLVNGVREEILKGYVLKETWVTEESLEGYTLKDTPVNKLQRKVDYTMKNHS